MSRPPATFSAVVITVACVVPVFLVGGLAVQLSEELDFSPAGLGLAVAVYFGVSALTSVPAGAVVERFGPAAAARSGILISAASLLAIALTARSYPVLVVLLALSAAANGLGQLAANALLARAGTRRPGLSFGIKQAAIPVATLLAGVSVPAVAITLGWRWAFGFTAALAAAALLVVVGPPPGAARRPARRERGRTATTPLVVIGVGVALAAAAAGCLGVFLVDSAATRGLAPGLAGLTLTFGSLACIAGRITAGWLADVRRAHGDVLPVAVQLLVGAGGLALLAVPGPVTLVIGVLLGFGFGWAFPGLVNFAVVQLHPRAPAAATAITQTGVYAGGCFGPLIFGAGAAVAGYPAAWLGAAVAMLLAAALILYARRLLRRRQPTTTLPS